MTFSVDQLLNEAMLLLASQPHALFLGQGVCYPGHALFKHLEGVPAQQRIELPVAEEMQLGMGIGLSLQGFLPVSIFPRIDFLMRAMDQLVNHLDKLSAMSAGQFAPKVIIRTRVGSKRPLDAGPQHTNNHTAGLMSMLTNVVVEELRDPMWIVDTYQRAIERKESTLVVENIAC